MRTVYRIQGPDGMGPYRLEMGTWNTHRHTRPTHPAIFDDCDLMDKATGWKVGETYFGFSSLDQLKAWFHDLREIERLEALGFKVVQWKVPDEDYLEGCRQIIFKTSPRVKKVGEVPWPKDNLKTPEEELEVSDVQM